MAPGSVVVLWGVRPPGALLEPGAGIPRERVRGVEPVAGFGPQMGRRGQPSRATSFAGMAPKRRYSTINLWMPKRERRVPFERMVFLGDGVTDIPSMNLVREKGGQVAVFDPEKFEQRLSQGHFERLIAEDRIDHMASADYRPGSLLTIVVEGILGRMPRHAVG